MRRGISGVCLLTMVLFAPLAGSATEAPLSQAAGDTAEGHVLVKLEEGARRIQALGSDSTNVFGSWHLEPVPSGMSAEELADELAGRADVEIVELDHRVQLDPVVTPGQVERATGASALAVDDPLSGLQWHFPAVALDEAWEDPGEGTVVAVLDTGVSQDGQDLDCHDFVSPYNAITQTAGSPAARDDHGHGSHVAGTVAQCTNNGTGVAGVAFEAELMPVKVLDSTGNGWTSDIARGIDWAHSNGADVINLSMGGPASSAIMNDAIEAAVADGIVVVAAAGNGNSATVNYPANHDHVIAVGATDYANQRSPYSNMGSSLDLAAPGGDLQADLNDDGHADGVLQETFCDSPGSCAPSVSGSSGWGYYFFQGTSMATPHVAGAAAILKSIRPDLGFAGVKSVLESTAADLGATGRDNAHGHGLIQIDDAVTLLEAPDDTAPIWPTGASLEVVEMAGGSVVLEWPEATDDQAIAFYQVLRSGKLVFTAHVTEGAVSVSSAEQELSVRAVDLAGNVSELIEVGVDASDSEAPKWGDDARIWVVEHGERELTFRWSGATDDVSVTGYRVGTVGSGGVLTSSPTATITGLEPGQTYQFEVMARDAAGNWSAPRGFVARTAQQFRDTGGSTFYNDILWISAMEITRGCNPPVNDRFCPDDPVTRGQMAAFLVRGLGLPDGSHPGFGDVAVSSTFAEDIERLAAAGVTRGCNPPVNDRFCPDDPVTRGQMAAFLRRGLEDR